MKSIKFIVRGYQNKETGNTFYKATCKGQYLPIVMCEVDKHYNIKFSSKSLAPLPQKEGIWEVAFDDDGIWLDTRAGYEDKDIVRINAKRVVFSKNLETSKE